jgi:calcineurin-like phosphoesterase family protein
MGHKRVINFHNDFRSKVMGVDTIEQHDDMICDLWNDVVTKRDVVYVLGDLGNAWWKLKDLPGTKKLHLGNHDNEKAHRYLEVFDDIIGCVSYKKHWITHIPMVQKELWGKKNIHGHTHSTGIADPMYINLSVEMTGGMPIEFGDIASGKFTTHTRVNLEEPSWT